MKFLVSSIILFLLLLQNVNSQDTNIIKYLPLKVGNVWVYNWIYMGNPPNGGITRTIVTNDTVINSHKYYKCAFPELGIRNIRADSISGNIYFFGGGCTYHPGETLIDSLLSKKLDTAEFCSTIHRKCIDTGFVTLFGNQFSKKDFQPIMELTASSRFYAKNLGLYFLDRGDPYLTRYTLRGCVINGIVYGDTSLPVRVQTISNEIPTSFSLSQNFPNPFNPTTKIKFAIPLSRGVSEGRGVSAKLVIYDILGREVASLINEQLQPGTYEVEWDGTNYPSGVYFYQLSINNELLATRKMVLVK